jgi:anti-sigma-K factor RskA
MTPASRDTDPRACGGDVAAYALGALDPTEVASFEAHLTNCAACRQELAAFQHVVDALPMSAPLHPAPRRLRRRVMTAVRREAGQTDGERGHGRAWSAGRLWLHRPAGALAAAAAALVLALVVVGGIAVLGSSSTTTHTYAARVTGVRGTARLTVSGGHAQLIVRHFSPPPKGKIYQVWVARKGQAPSSTGMLFSVTRSGNSDVNVPGSLRGVSAVMVTPEPAGGSKAPTHAPVITALLG